MDRMADRDGRHPYSALNLEAKERSSMKNSVVRFAEVLRQFAPVCLSVAAMSLLTCGVANASDCDATTSPDYCQPVQIRASAAVGGIEIRWSLLDEVLPNAIVIYRQAAGTAGPTPGSRPLVSFQNSGGGSALDTTAQVNTLYRYWVCAVWDNQGQVCAPHVEQGLPGGPPPGPGPPARVAPSNLQVTEVASWVTPSHFQRLWKWSWRAGQGYDVTARETASNNGGWNQEGSNLTNSSTAFEEVKPVFMNAAIRQRVCGAIKSNFTQSDIGCTNAVNVQPSPPPAPRVPISIHAWLTVNNQVEITFNSGDDNVSSWFEVEQMGSGVGRNGPPPTVWTLVEPRINFGSRGLVIDRNDRPRDPMVFKPTVKPYTYRVCAGNAYSRTCSGPVVSKPSQVVPIVR